MRHKQTKLIAVRFGPVRKPINTSLPILGKIVAGGRVKWSNRAVEAAVKGK